MATTVNCAGTTVYTGCVNSGDTWMGLSLVVYDSANSSHIFSGTTITVELKSQSQASWSPSQVLYSANLTPDELIPGSVSALFQLPPEITVTFGNQVITGTVVFTFSDTDVAGSPMKSTQFSLILTASTP